MESHTLTRGCVQIRHLTSAWMTLCICLTVCLSILLTWVVVITENLAAVWTTFHVHVVIVFLWYFVLICCVCSCSSSFHAVNESNEFHVHVLPLLTVELKWEAKPNIRDHGPLPFLRHYQWRRLHYIRSDFCRSWLTLFLEPGNIQEILK